MVWYRQYHCSKPIRIAGSELLSTRDFTWTGLLNQMDGSKEPHGNLPTNVLQEEELCRVHHVILTTATLNWKDMSLSWSACESTFMRWNSISKHCPPNQGRRSVHGMMTHILRKRIHKEKGPNTRVTGAWRRHRNVFRCCTGYLAMNLFVRLHMDRTLHFYKSNSPNPKVPPTGGVNTSSASGTMTKPLTRRTEQSFGHRISSRINSTASDTGN
jgi:hypothetical protein